MPEKTRERRAKIARRRGQTMAIKPRDVGKVGPRSAHGAKKSSQLVGLTKPGARNASVKSPPRAGKKTVDARLAAYRRETLAGAVAKHLQAEEVKPPLRGLRGRKKPPSRVAIKRKGGAFKRSRLKGG